MGFIHSGARGVLLPRFFAQFESCITIRAKLVTKIKTAAPTSGLSGFHTSNVLTGGGGREFFHHCKEQFAIAVVEVGGIATNLVEEAELIVVEAVAFEDGVDGSVGEELGEWNVERLGDFAQCVERGDGMSVLDA